MMQDDEDRDDDRDKDEIGGDLPAGLGHEKLKVYGQALDYVAWTHSVLAEVEQPAVVLDHWIRAAESIIENIANGNSRRARADRNQYFDIAIGSTLECAACLDICFRRDIKGTTSIVLNIAEGNGRFSAAEQTRFLDTAHTCAMRVAACLDVLVARQRVERFQITEGKRILAGIVPLVLGLRNYLKNKRSKE